MHTLFREMMLAEATAISPMSEGLSKLMHKQIHDEF